MQMQMTILPGPFSCIQLCSMWGIQKWQNFPRIIVELKERYDAGGFYDVIPQKRL